MPLDLRSETLRASDWVGIQVVPGPSGDAGPSSAPLKRNELDDPERAGDVDVDQAQAKRVGADDSEN